MNGLDKFLKAKEETENKWKNLLNSKDFVENFRWVCGTFCFIWINLFAAILPPIALFNFYKGNVWEAGGELAFALLAVYANKAILR